MAESTDPRRHAPVDPLERELLELGQHLAYPAGATLALAVRARLVEPPRQQTPFWSRWFGTSRRGLATAALLAVLVCAAVLAASPGTRSTVADRLGVPGIGISTSDTPATPTGTNLSLGQEMTLAAAVAQVGFDPLTPPSSLGEPDTVYVRETPGGAQIAYVYAPRDDLPEVGDSGVGLLVMQFRGHTTASLIQKQLGPSTTLELVAVGGRQGYWISGAPHVFFYQDAAGDIQQETLRLAANVLLWEHAGRTLRIESALDRDTVIRIAESMAVD